MDLCTECGAELGVGRFCTNCGHPTKSVPARFPLFADDAPRVEQERSARSPRVGVTRTTPPRHRDERRVPAPWIAGLTVLALAGGIGLWLLLDPDDEPTRAVDPAAASTPSSKLSSDASPDPEPTATGRARPSPAVQPVELAPATSVDAPAPAPPSRDSSGSTVRFVATHMTDGVDETTWRMPGDGTDASITFRLDSPAVMTEVGLINGYAKVGEDSRGLLDWYAGNRRVLQVEWTFDDGTVVTQALRESADLQRIPVDDVETESITLRLVEVSDPGTGRASRDYTAISDVSLVGAAKS
ncbi:MAG: NADase-type glycan-binding domain-containing protein [Nocardioides sp.]